MEKIWQQDIEPRIFARSTPEEHPILILLGGQPGSGKTRLAHLITREIYGTRNITQIIGDDFRQFHPHYRRLLETNPAGMPSRTAKAAGFWTEKAIEFALKKRISILIEGTFRNPETPLFAAGSAKKSGYEVYVFAMAVPPFQSKLGTLERFYRALADKSAARWTPPAIHDQAVASLPGSVKDLGDAKRIQHLTVSDRDLKALYEGSYKPRRGDEASKVITVAHAADDISEKDRTLLLELRALHYQYASKVDEALEVLNHMCMIADVDQAKQQVPTQ